MWKCDDLNLTYRRLSVSSAINNVDMTMSTTKDSLEPTTEPGYDIQGHSQVRRCRVCSSSTLKMIAATLCIAGAVATCA